MLIDAARLLEDLRTLAQFGRYETGVDRIAFSEPDRAARAWLKDRMSAAGLEARIDGLGNVCGRSPLLGPAVLVGSHTDTVRKGGWLDGALGVVYGLEIARSRREKALPGAVDVISFQDEEGTFLPCLGSRAFCGELGEDEIARARGPGQQPLAEAIAASGFGGPPCRLDPDRVRAVFEAHIEQGPRLEAANIAVGVVTGIVGVRRLLIETTGRADHAGTTPMAMRRDAGAALIRIAHEVLGALPGIGSAESVWNIGVLDLEPGSPNVVPRTARLVVEFRDLNAEVMDRIEAGVRKIAQRFDANGPCSAVTKPFGRVDPIEMDPWLRELLVGAATRLGHAATLMSSGAGHDAMILAKHVPTALLFVPSIGGRSHDVAENTRDEDIVAGAAVLAEAIDAFIEERSSAER